MRYYVILKNGETFNTKWFDEDNNWSEQIHCVIDFDLHKYMIDGKAWIDIKDDHL